MRRPKVADLIEQRRDDLYVTAGVVQLILQQQETEPGYQQEMLDALVHSELQRLEREMGQTLDMIAEGR